MPLKGQIQSPSARHKIGLARKALAARKKKVIVRRNRARVIEGLHALQAKGEPIYSAYVKAHDYPLYDLARRAFGSYEMAIRKGLGLDYSTVKVSIEERSRRVQASSKKLWSEATLKKRREQLHKLARKRYLAHHLRKTSFIIKLLTLRLQGYHHSVIMHRFGISETAWIDWSARVMKAIPVDLQERWRAIARAIQYGQIKRKLNGPPAVSFADAKELSAEFKRTELKKFSDNRKRVYALAITGKSIKEIAVDLNVSEKEATALVSMLPFQQLERVRLAWLRRANQRRRFQQLAFTGSVSSAT